MIMNKMDRVHLAICGRMRRKVRRAEAKYGNFRNHLAGDLAVECHGNSVHGRWIFSNIVRSFLWSSWQKDTRFPVLLYLNGSVGRGIAAVRVVRRRWSTFPRGRFTVRISMVRGWVVMRWWCIVWRGMLALSLWIVLRLSWIWIVSCCASSIISVPISLNMD